MTITFVSSDWLVPKRWRTSLGPRVAKLSIPELDETFSVAEEILDQRSDAEIQSLAHGLVQLIAPESAAELEGVPLGFSFEPRIVYQLFIDGLTSEESQDLTLLESMAVGALIALSRACKVVEQVRSSGNALSAYTAIASARACGEWLYMVSSLKSNADALEHLFPRQVRTAAKKKISAKASTKSKAVWGGKLGPEKKKVIDAYEAGKPWKDTKAAATKIHGDEITTAVMYDKLYKWLLAYANGKPF